MNGKSQLQSSSRVDRFTKKFGNWQAQREQLARGQAHVAEAIPTFTPDYVDDMTYKQNGTVVKTGPFLEKEGDIYRVGASFTRDDLVNVLFPEAHNRIGRLRMFCMADCNGDLVDYVGGRFADRASIRGAIVHDVAKNERGAYKQGTVEIFVESNNVGDEIIQDSYFTRRPMVWDRYKMSKNFGRIPSEFKNDNEVMYWCVPDLEFNPSQINMQREFVLPLSKKAFNNLLNAAWNMAGEYSEVLQGKGYSIENGTAYLATPPSDQSRQRKTTQH